jgi:hypothetical protein
MCHNILGSQNVPSIKTKSNKKLVNEKNSHLNMSIHSNSLQMNIHKLFFKIENINDNGDYYSNVLD